MFRRIGTRHHTVLSFSILICIITILTIHLIKSSSDENFKETTRSIIFSNRSLNIEDKRTSIDDVSILCLNMADYLDNEQNLPQSPLIYSPTFKSPRIFRFPYRYSHWKSSSILPRALTPCEHNLAMQLLMFIDRICRENEIIYFMSEGTLLGSMRHHDIIPWDDDIDIILSYEQRQLFVDTIIQLNSTLIGLYLLKGKVEKKDYYKLYYKSNPSAGGYKWKFPFIDIFFYQQNETHLWNSKYPDTMSKIRNVFPLILRPLGQLWIPSARKPFKFFQFDPFEDCVGHFWDHRNETGKEEIRMKCDQLKDVYPFVERINKTDSVEVLKINNTIIHTVSLQ